MREFVQACEHHANEGTIVHSFVDLQ